MQCLFSNPMQGNFEAIGSDWLQETVCYSQVKRLDGIMSVFRKEHNDGSCRQAKQLCNIETRRLQHFYIHKNGVRLKRVDPPDNIFTRRRFDYYLKVRMRSKSRANSRRCDWIGVGQKHTNPRHLYPASRSC
jgi:hypothetical protein